ncbi:MAG: patatin-like phospholipase family protein [Burkholderiales bacterium]|nr:patatin-like phospholipase family protein [Burkholderiales bacterium]
MLTGGGARAAYQVGVLRALAHILPHGISNPFPIVCGTSAGAINAVALAAGAADFHRAVRRLQLVWRNFGAHQVYRSDPIGIAATGAGWLLEPLLRRLGREEPVALLDNSPLTRFLRERLDLHEIGHMISANVLRAVAVSASSYSTGESISFYQGNELLSGWRRARRVGVRVEIGIEHLLASSALPFIFRPVRIRREYFGDGSMRQMAPLSPALHLGAQRVFVISVGRQVTGAQERVRTEAYPSLAQIAGHALNSIFLDGLETDIERLQRINRTLRLMPPESRDPDLFQLREVEVLVMRPTEDLGALAAQHAHELPITVRMLMSVIGGMGRGGGTLVSYLLFERGYCRALIDLGYRDTMARRDEVSQFLGITPPATKR